MIKFANKLSPAHRTLVFAGIFALSCATLFAQTESQTTPAQNGPTAGATLHHRPGVEGQVKHLTRALSLTADQQTQVKALLESQRQQIQQLRQSAPANSANGQAAQPDRTQFQAIRQDTRTKIEALLNDQQKAKFEAMLQRRQQMIEQRQGTTGGEVSPNSDVH
jgi:Spy/CpxP family protein refolding chaperone